MPESISTASGSLRCVTWRLLPGRRRSRAVCMSASDKGMPGGQPSITQPMAGPWDSPKLVTANRVPKVLPLMGMDYSMSGPGSAGGRGQARVGSGRGAMSERVFGSQPQRDLAGEFAAIAMRYGQLRVLYLALAGLAHQLLRGFDHGEQPVHAGVRARQSAAIGVDR